MTDLERAVWTLMATDDYKVVSQDARRAVLHYVHNVPPHPEIVVTVEWPATYRVVRFYQRDDIPDKIIKSGLSLAEARAHCSDPETSGSTAVSDDGRAETALFGPWFDGYEEED